MEEGRELGEEKAKEGEPRSAWSNPEGLAERIKKTEGNRRKIAEGAYGAMLQRRSREGTLREVPVEKIEGKIMIDIPEDILEKNTRLWEFGLVGRFTGPRPELDRIRLWAAQRWKISNLEIVALPRGCVLFNFQNETDMLGVLLKAPWYMGGKALTLEKWHEGFDPKDEEAKMIPVWVQVPGLPLQAWDENVIRGIAGAIGKLVAIDTATKNKTRLIHARFCVLVKSDEAVPSSVELKMGSKVWRQDLIYEDSRTECTKCRRGYHIPQRCPGKGEEEKKEGPKKMWVPKRKEKEPEEQGEGETEGRSKQAEGPMETGEEGQKEQKEGAKAAEAGNQEDAGKEEGEKGGAKELEETEEEAAESAEEGREEFEKVQTRRSKRRQEGGKMDIGSEERKMGRPTDKERREKEAASQIDMGIQKTLDSVRGRGKPRK